MTIKQAQKLAKQKLSKKRYIHTKNVVCQAQCLAAHWGANPKKAQLAAWLHDIAKECTREELLQLLQRGGIMAKAATKPAAVWHGPAAAVYAQQVLAVSSGQVLCAIAAHTTGKKGMSLLDKIIYLADATSAERSYPGVEELRELAYQNLDAAVIKALRQSLVFLQEIGAKIDEDTKMALEELEGAT